MENKRNTTTTAKKFGAFAGVFTPSLLTILGVIMYLRLGWVTGVAGLWGVLIIILLAHVISVTTGLSISSIATDKRIKAGGLYYMLSRSLGLPMGGSIGITLFVGTALSISLYLVGFTESFLSVDFIRDAMGIGEITTDHVRVIGSVMLALLVIIALISTNFAIKTQFVILAAIGLSLISVFVGLIMNQPAAGVEMHPVRSFDSFSFSTVFAIFFPAVTGFTAGVAMSGDLKDPKKDIPKGTMLSISAGLIIYLGLALGFYFFVPQETLLSNYNFLLTVAWLPSLVLAGIWGATLSSALGGILGGPRILQAIAVDRIVPGFLSKGYGPSREPRIALITTFMIAEIGILIGDLNVIAGVVTMFYLTAYGFINFAFALEKWASVDFRPSFNISLWVGVVGFLSVFFVMVQLDILSMAAALLIMFLIFTSIRRKKLSLAMGDVWMSVRANLVRKLLTTMDAKQLTERNWRANILLFSGGTANRPYLIEFGRSLVGQHGLVSNFDLVLTKGSKVLFPKHKQAIPDDVTADEEGVFSRRQECTDIYEGIQSIAATYGFSGVEPNTVLLGWGRHTEDPVGFARMLRHLSDLDLNIVLLDYHPEKGFGNYRRIDLWWRGGSNNGNLVLALIKFMRTTFEWRNATVRLMIINDRNDQKQRIERDAKSVLDNMRMDVDIRILNNQYDKRPVNMIIKQHSADADLIFLGLADVREGQEMEFIQRADELYKDLGTLALVNASSFFRELHIGLSGTRKD